MTVVHTARYTRTRRDYLCPDCLSIHRDIQDVNHFSSPSSLLLDVAVSTTAQAAYWSGVPRNCKNTRLNGHQRNTLAGASHAGLHARLLLASSWPVLALVAKPFTNSVECVLVAVLLLVVVGVGAGDDVDGDMANSCLSKQSQTAETTTTTNSGVTKQQSPTATRKRERKARVRDVSARAFVAGAVCAIGTWTRFTFPCFAVPLLLALLTNAGTCWAGGTQIPDDDCFTSNAPLTVWTFRW